MATAEGVVAAANLRDVKVVDLPLPQPMRSRDRDNRMINLLDDDTPSPAAPIAVAAAASAATSSDRDEVLVVGVRPPVIGPTGGADEDPNESPEGDPLSHRTQMVLAFVRRRRRRWPWQKGPCHGTGGQGALRAAMRCHASRGGRGRRWWDRENRV